MERKARQMYQRFARDKKTNKLMRSSQSFISDRFIILTLLLNLVFYTITFTVPSMTVIDCIQGHSNMALVTIGIFLLCVFCIDLVNMSYYCQRELQKIELRNFYGRHTQRNKLITTGTVYLTALSELVFTQLCLFDIYTDYSFITMTAMDPQLTAFCTLSSICFAATMLPKAYSVFLLVRVLFMDATEQPEKGTPL